MVMFNLTHIKQTAATISIFHAGKYKSAKSWCAWTHCSSLL